MTDKQKVVWLRFARTLGATIVAGLATYLAGPAAVGLVSEAYQPLVALVIIPALVTIDKALRMKSDDGSGEAGL